MTGKTFIITRRVKLLSHAFNIGTERPILASHAQLLCKEGPMDKNGHVHAPSRRGSHGHIDSTGQSPYCGFMHSTVIYVEASDDFPFNPEDI